MSAKSSTQAGWSCGLRPEPVPISARRSTRPLRSTVSSRARSTCSSSFPRARTARRTRISSSRRGGRRRRHAPTPHYALLVSWLILAIFAAAIAPAAVAVWRRPILALYALALGLVVHNAAFMLLYAAGGRGWQLTVAQSWKEILFAVAAAGVCRDAGRGRRLPFRPHAVDAAAMLFVAIVVVYALVPQQVLGGAAD